MVCFKILVLFCFMGFLFLFFGDTLLLNIDSLIHPFTVSETNILTRERQYGYSAVRINISVGDSYN